MRLDRRALALDVFAIALVAALAVRCYAPAEDVFAIALVAALAVRCYAPAELAAEPLCTSAEGAQLNVSPDAGLCPDFQHDSAIIAAVLADAGLPNPLASVVVNISDVASEVTVCDSDVIVVSLPTSALTDWPGQADEFGHGVGHVAVGCHGQQKDHAALKALGFDKKCDAALKLARHPEAL